MLDYALGSFEQKASVWYIFFGGRLSKGNSGSVLSVLDHCIFFIPDSIGFFALAYVAVVNYMTAELAPLIRLGCT